MTDEIATAKLAELQTAKLAYVLWRRLPSQWNYKALRSAALAAGCTGADIIEWARENLS